MNPAGLVDDVIAVGVLGIVADKTIDMIKPKKKKKNKEYRSWF